MDAENVNPLKPVFKADRIPNESIEVPLKNGVSGEIIGTAVLTPTSESGIYLTEMVIDGQKATGYVQLPIKPGDKIDTAWMQKGS